jgi:hypothetical protein
MDSAWLTLSRLRLATVVGLPVALVVGGGVAAFVPVLMAVSVGFLAGALSAGLADHHARAQREQVRAAVGELALPIQLAGYRATRRGAIPADPEIVAAAVRVARHQLALSPQPPALYALIPLCVGVIPLSIGATTRSNAFAPVVVVFAGMSVLCAVSAAVQAVWLPRRLRARLLALDAGVEPVRAGGDGS